MVLTQHYLYDKYYTEWRGWWLFTPIAINNYTAYQRLGNVLTQLQLDSDNYIRPVVSLKHDITILQGDGTPENLIVINEE